MIFSTQTYLKPVRLEYRILVLSALGFESSTAKYFFIVFVVLSTGRHSLLHFVKSELDGFDLNPYHKLSSKEKKYCPSPLPGYNLL